MFRWYIWWMGGYIELVYMGYFRSLWMLLDGVLVDFWVIVEVFFGIILDFVFDFVFEGVLFFWIGDFGILIFMLDGVILIIMEYFKNVEDL